MKKRHFQWFVADWCHRQFGAKLGSAELVQMCKALGAGLGLVDENKQDMIQAAGVPLTCVLPPMEPDPDGTQFAPFVPGFNDPKHGDRVFTAVDKALNQAAGAKIPFVIVFSGMGTGEDRDTQFTRIVQGFTTPGPAGESLVSMARHLGVTLVMEALNTRGEESTWRGHPGYLAHSTTELVEKVVQPVGNEAFRLAYDVYHSVMMGEDPVEMARKHGQYIAYIHVAGVMLQDSGHHLQNRGELTLAGQRVDYPAVFRALAEAGVPEGTHALLEYIPNKTQMAGVQSDLWAAIDLCESGISN